MKIVNIEELKVYTPPDHYKMLNGQLIGENVGAKQVRVTYGVADSGGKTAMHSHLRVEKIYFIIGGELRVIGEREAMTIRKGMALFIPPGEVHCTCNPGPEKAEYLVINVT